MANPTDLQGMLTSQLLQPQAQAAIPSTYEQRMLQQGQKFATGLRRGIGAMTGSDTRSTAEKAQAMMANLDINDPKDQPKILQLVNSINPAQAPKLVAAFAQQKRQSDEKQSGIDAKNTSRKKFAEYLDKTYPNKGYGTLALQGLITPANMKNFIKEADKDTKVEIANLVDTRTNQSVKQIKLIDGVPHSMEGTKLTAQDLQDRVVSKTYVKPSSPLVSTKPTAKEKARERNFESQGKLYESTQEKVPAAQKNLATAEGILDIVDKGTPTGGAGSLVANFATTVQSISEVLGREVPDEVRNATADLANMKRYAGEALMPFIAQQGRGFTDTEREYFLENVIAGYNQPWQFNEAYGTVLKSQALSDIEKNNFAFTIKRSDTLTDQAPNNLWADYERKVPRLKIGTKERGGQSYEGVIVIQDNENLSQYWTKASPKGFKVDAGGGQPIIEYSWEDLNETAADRGLSVRQLLAFYSRQGYIVGGIY